MTPAGPTRDHAHHHPSHAHYKPSHAHHKPSHAHTALVVLIILLLVSVTPQGCGAYMVTAPTQYVALQGHLTATVILSTPAPPTDAPLTTWDFDNHNTSTSNASASDTSASNASASNTSASNTSAIDDDLLDMEAAGEDLSDEVEVLEKGDGSPISSPLMEEEPKVPLMLSLYARGSTRAIKQYLVVENLTSLTFVFPCGTVVQGGIHYFRLERGAEVVAVSGEVEVSWPEMSIQVHPQVETYTTPVEVVLRFTRGICRPQSPSRFHVWVELLYHGVPVGGQGAGPEGQDTPPRTPQSRGRSIDESPWSPLEDERIRRALSRAKNRKKYGRRESKKKYGRTESKKKYGSRNKKARRKGRRANGLRGSPRSPTGRRRQGGTETKDNEAIGSQEEIETENGTTPKRNRRRDKFQENEDSTEEDEARTHPGEGNEEQGGGLPGKTTTTHHDGNTTTQHMGNTTTNHDGNTTTTIQHMEGNTTTTHHDGNTTTTHHDGNTTTTQHQKGDNKTNSRETGKRENEGNNPHRTEEIEQQQREESKNITTRPKRSPPDVRTPKGVLVTSSSKSGGSSAWGGSALRLGNIPLPGLYSDASHTVSFPCRAIGPEGLYSVRLATGVKTAPVIASSDWFKVVWSEEFSVYVDAASIVPCRGSIGVTVSHPKCIGKLDKIRLFAKVRANVTSADPPQEDMYVTEKRVIPGRKSVMFGCDVFQREATDWCFVYVNTASTKAVNEVTRRCIPTFKTDVLRKEGGWGGWSAWTSCTSSCGKGQRLRHRFCDNPPSRNGGAYCQGSSVDSIPCDGPPCDAPHPPPAATPGGLGCECGCTVPLHPGHVTTITASAAKCSGTSLWLLQAPGDDHVVAQVSWASLWPGAQWLKLRDGDTVGAPLLVRLPSEPAESPFTDAFVSSSPSSFPPSPSAPSPRRTTPPAPRLTSTGNFLLLEFRSDVNASMAGLTPAAWGFLITVTPSVRGVDGVEGAVTTAPTYSLLLEGMHVAAIVFVAGLIAAVVALAVYHFRRYRLYKRARLIPESPYMTPPSTPSKDLVVGASTLTLTEIISLKSLKLRTRLSSVSHRRRSGSVSYSPVDDSQSSLYPRRSLPNSPFLTRRLHTPAMLRRSSSQLSRLIRKGSGNFKRRKRRYASVDELESRCISPIHETHREEESDGGKDDRNVDKGKEGSEEESKKYREYRKSLLVGEDGTEQLLPLKLAKERTNLERARKSAMSRAVSNATMRASSSASEISVNGTDTDMEYDYYDYDMDNASAVPGSIFGLDPLLLAWLPPFIPLGGEGTPTADQEIPLNILKFSETAQDTPDTNDPPRPTDLPLKYLNIPNPEPPHPPPPHVMHASIVSEENNDRVEVHEEDDAGDDEHDVPFAINMTPTANQGKILNLDDFQFADDSDEDEL